MDNNIRFHITKFNLEYDTIRALVLIVSNLFRNSITLPIGIMDFDPDYIPGA